MTTAHWLKAGGVALCLAAVPYGAASAASTQTATNEAPESVIMNWPKEVQEQARALVERYGEPGASDANALVWLDNGPWRKTVLHREGFTHSVMGRDRDHLEQVISYQVPEEKVAELQRFDKRISVNRAADELSSHADSESMNFLALNLADDIVKGERTAQGARMFYRKVKMLEKAGKSSPYLEGLLFAKESGKERMPVEMEPSEKATEDGGVNPPIHEETPKP